MILDPKIGDIVKFTTCSYYSKCKYCKACIGDAYLKAKQNSIGIVIGYIADLTFYPEIEVRINAKRTKTTESFVMINNLFLFKTKLKPKFKISNLDIKINIHEFI